MTPSIIFLKVEEKKKLPIQVSKNKLKLRNLNNTFFSVFEGNKYNSLLNYR